MNPVKRITAIAAVVASAAALWFLAKPEGRRIRIHSLILDETRTLLLDLPPDYATSGRSFPVLFILDALNRSTTYGPSFFRVASRIKEMGKEGLPPMILVGVVNTQRPRDMLPVKTDLEPGSGQASRFLQFFDRELIPRIEKEFRTSGERLVYGRSDSGLFVLYALLEKPALFTAHIASSPTVGFCPEWIRRQTERLFGGRPTAKTCLFIISGENDIPLVKDALPDVVGEFRRLRTAPFRFEAVVVAGGGHVPESGLFHGLRFVFSGTR